MEQRPVENVQLGAKNNFFHIFLIFFSIFFWRYQNYSYLCTRNQEMIDASLAQLVEHDTLNVGVQGSSPWGGTKEKDPIRIGSFSFFYLSRTRATVGISRIRPAPHESPRNTPSQETRTARIPQVSHHRRSEIPPPRKRKSVYGSPHILHPLHFMRRARVCAACTQATTAAKFTGGFDNPDIFK